VTIDYCRKFNVPLAPWINVNEGTYIYQTSGKLKGQKVRVRDAIADTTGYMAELVERSVKADQADLVLSANEKQQILNYLSRYGFLDRDGIYRGRQRRSFKSYSGAGPLDSEYEKPYPLVDLFEAGLGGYFHFIDANDQQMTMLEIVGGVDKLAKAFQSHIKSPIQFGCQVTDINTSNSGVTVSYVNSNGNTRQVSADFCICTIPLPVLKKIATNFDAPTTAVVKNARYANSTKVASEYKRRFWEEDEKIFGGISWTDMPIGQVIYPSHDFFSKSGVLVNYTNGLNGQLLAKMPVDKRMVAALDMNAQIHPQVRKELRSTVTLSWANVPYSEGAFATWGFAPNSEASYQLLCQPQGRLYFAGEHASQITAWMAGAIESARYVVKQIAISAQQSSL
jgi:monoamine oxidase